MIFTLRTAYMAKHPLLIAVSLLAMLVFIACQKEISQLLTSARPQDRVVTASFIGRVSDENGAPLPNVMVTSGDKQSFVERGEAVSW